MNIVNEDLEKLKLKLINKIKKVTNKEKLSEINFLLKNSKEKEKNIQNKQNRVKMIKELSINQIKNFNEDNIKELSLLDFIEMSESQLNAINKDLMKYLPFQIFRYSKTGFLKKLDKEILLSLSSETIGNIFDFPELDPREIINVVNNLLTDEQAYYLVTYNYGSKLNEIKNKYVLNLIKNKSDNYLKIKYSENRVKKLNISKMSANNFKNIPANKLSHLTKKQINNLTDEHFSLINNQKANKLIVMKYS